MGRRIDLHELICSKLGEIANGVFGAFDFNNNDVESAINAATHQHVYYQPPASIKLNYPCVVYRLEDIPAIYANNLPYHWDNAYQLTVIDRDPESAVREKIKELPMCRFVRSFVSENLNHYIFRVFY